MGLDEATEMNEDVKNNVVGSEIRTFTCDGVTLYLGHDVCTSLGFKRNPSRGGFTAIYRHVPAAERRLVPVPAHIDAGRGRGPRVRVGLTARGVEILTEFAQLRRRDKTKHFRPKGSKTDGPIYHEGRPLLHG